MSGCRQSASGGAGYLSGLLTRNPHSGVAVVEAVRPDFVTLPLSTAREVLIVGFTALGYVHLFIACLYRGCVLKK